MCGGEVPNGCNGVSLSNRQFRVEPRGERVSRVGMLAIRTMLVHRFLLQWNQAVLNRHRRIHQAVGRQADPVQPGFVARSIQENPVCALLLR